MLPLEGVRVLDFGQAWAGPHCAMVLGDLGAEIIKVETSQRLDLARTMGPFADGQPGPNRSGRFNNFNRHKRSMTVNLKDPRGLELVKKLVEHSDVVVENFSPRVMEGLGLGYEQLRQVNAGIIMISLSGFGAHGPYRGYLAYGSIMEGYSGLLTLVADAQGSPATLGLPYSDPTSGLLGAVVVIALLIHRRESGKGQWIDLSELEALIACIPEPFLEQLWTGCPRPPGRNRHPWQVPHGCYPCKGEDEWVAIAVTSDEEWRGLRAAMGDPAWAREGGCFDSMSGRWARQDELDSHMRAWTKGYSPSELMELLQHKGVPAGVSQSGAEVLSNPQLRQRGFFPVVEHLEVGKREIQGIPFHINGTPLGVRKVAPLLGEDNRYVCCDLLGLGPEEVQKLEEAQVLR